MNGESIPIGSAPGSATLAFNPVFSITDNAVAQPTRTATAMQLVDLFRTGEHRPLVAKIRKTFARVFEETGDLKAAKNAVASDKKNLPSVMPSGIFRARGDKNLETYSYILCADVDGLATERVGIVYDQLAGDPHCCTVSVSPTGSGVKALCPTTGDAEQHGQSMAAMAKYFRETYGLEIDPSCNNLERLCFAPDNASEWNENAIPFDPLPLDVKTIGTRPLALPPSAHPSNRNAAAERLFGAIQWEDEITGFCKCPGEHLHTTPTDAKHCRVKLDGVPTVSCFHGSCAGILSGVNHELRSQIGKAEFVPTRKPQAAQPENGGAIAPSSSRVNGTSATPEGIVLPSGFVSISESARTIYQLIAPAQTLFWRGGVQVELVEIDGVPSLKVLKPEKFCSDVEKLGQLWAWRAAGKGEPALKPAHLTVDLAKRIMASSEASEFLPPIASVLQCPVLVETNSGDVEILGKGYHPELGGLLIVNGDTPPQIPLAEAVEALRWTVEEFDFQTKADYSRALAAFILPAMRFAGLLRDKIPIDFAEANASQAGKGHRHEMVFSLYNETAYLVTDKVGGVGSVDESFQAALVSARPFICLDNFRGRMNSKLLESFLTASGFGLFPARTPGTAEVLIDPRRFILQMSSNGLHTSVDLANRVSFCRIRKRPGYNYRDTLGEIKRRQPYFLGCVFAVIAEWIRKGKPRTNDTRHDFREWSQSLDWIVQNILGCEPLMDGHQAAQERTSNPALTFLRSVALGVEAENRLDVALIASELVEVCELHAIEIPSKPADTDRAKRQVGSLCKQVFRTGDSVNVDGFTITRSDKGYRKPSGDLDTTNAYTFKK